MSYEDNNYSFDQQKRVIGEIKDLVVELQNYTIELVHQAIDDTLAEYNFNAAPRGNEERDRVQKPVEGLDNEIEGEIEKGTPNVDLSQDSISHDDEVVERDVMMGKVDKIR